MSKTDAEWRVLDKRIAREVMDLLVWDDLTPEEQQGYIDVVPPKFLNRSMREWKRSYWKRAYGSVFTVDDYSDWQPHKNRSQAMDVLEAVRGKGCWSAVRMRDGKYKPYTCRLSWGWDSEKCTWQHDDREGDDLPQTICLTIEAYLDAQKEEQDDPS